MENISFRGRNEVLYGLKNAALCSKVIASMEKGSHAMRKSSITTAIASRDAYLDMVCHDELFLNTISYLTPKDISRIGSTLSEYQTRNNSTVKPLTNFKKALIKIFSKHGTKEESEIVEHFLSILA